MSGGEGSSGSSAGSSASGEATGSSATSMASGEVSSGGTSGATTEGLKIDMGIPDVSGGPPAGCKGKIDFVFVISNSHGMESVADRVAASLPGFIETIESKFEDFDAHIMVVDGDGQWGSPVSCAPGPACPDGQGCTAVEEPMYPCWAHYQPGALGPCDNTLGAGVTFPAGKAVISFSWDPFIVQSREITKRKSILPLQPGGLASPMSMSDPTSSSSVVPLPPTLVSMFIVDAAPEVEAEPLWPLLLLESAAVVLEVDAVEVVIAGIVVKPDVSVCDG